MVPVQDQQLVKGINDNIIDQIGHYRRIEHHIEEVGTIRQVEARIDPRVPLGTPVREGGDSPHLGEKPGCRNIQGLLGIVHLGIEAVHTVHHR